MPVDLDLRVEVAGASHRYDCKVGVRLSRALHTATPLAFVVDVAPVGMDDVTASGTKTLVTRGYLKASHYKSHSDRAPIPLGQAITYTVPLWHVDYRFPAGDHIELLLESGEQECCLSSAPAAAQPLLPLAVSVGTGLGGSTLSLPLSPG